MSSTALTTLQEEPLTVAIMAVCSVVWFWMWNRRISADNVAISFRSVVAERHYYRVVTAAFVHLSWMHIIFNMATLFTFHAEPGMGTLEYLRVTILLLFLCKFVWLACMAWLIFRGGFPQYVDSSAAGYSGVLFGWMALQSLRAPTAMVKFMGIITMPSLLAPWVSLVLTQMLVPQASFLGHLAGIIAGYAVAVHALDWLTGYWFWTGLLYVSAILLLSLKANANTPWLNNWVTVSPAFVQHTGLGVGIDGLPTAAAATRASTRYMSNGVLRVVRHVEGEDEGGTGVSDRSTHAAPGAGADAGWRGWAASAWQWARRGGGGPAAVAPPAARSHRSAASSSAAECVNVRPPWCRGCRSAAAARPEQRCCQ